MRACILALLLVVPATLHAERLPLKAYTVADGLPNNVINKIVRDSRGFLWFCTNEGLSRFDGYTFTNYGVDQGLPHSMVNDFLETRNGEIWIATNGGLVFFNPKGSPTPTVAFANQKLKTASMFTVVVPEDQDRAASAASVLFEDSNGTLWCGTMRHLYRLDRQGSDFKLTLIDLGVKETFILDLLEDQESLWIASFNGIYRRRADGSVEHYTTKEGLPDNTIQDLLKDHEGRLWAATRLGGFFRINPDSAKSASLVAEVYNKRNGLATDWVFQLYETTNHKFWLATNAGLIEFFPDSSEKAARFHPYTRRNGLTFHEITALEEDVSGNLWLGTNVTGAMKLERDGFTTYDEADGIATMNAVFGDRADTLCFRAFITEKPARNPANATQDKPTVRQRLGCYRNQQFRWFMPQTLKNDGWVFEHVTLQTRSGEWWIGTGSGVFRFSARALFDQNDPSPCFSAQTFQTVLTGRITVTSSRFS